MCSIVPAFEISFPGQSLLLCFSSWDCLKGSLLFRSISINSKFTEISIRFNGKVLTDMSFSENWRRWRNYKFRQRFDDRVIWRRCNPFSPRSRLLLIISFNYSSFNLLLALPSMLLVSFYATSHFLQICCMCTGIFRRFRTWDGGHGTGAHEASEWEREILVVSAWRFFFTLRLNFQLQFDSLALQLTFDAMKRSKTLIISTSRTLRLVARHPKGLLQRSLFPFVSPFLQRFAFLETAFLLACPLLLVA